MKILNIILLITFLSLTGCSHFNNDSQPSSNFTRNYNLKITKSNVLAKENNLKQSKKTISSKEKAKENLILVKNVKKYKDFFKVNTNKGNYYIFKDISNLQDKNIYILSYNKENFNKPIILFYSQNKNIFKNDLEQFKNKLKISKKNISRLEKRINQYKKEN